MEDIKVDRIHFILDDIRSQAVCDCITSCLDKDLPFSTSIYCGPNSFYTSLHPHREERRFIWEEGSYTIFNSTNEGKKIKAKGKVKMKKFKKIYIEITNNCNLNCGFCSEVKRKRRIMSKKDFENVLIKIKDYTNYIYLHVKGEPLLHPQIIDFIKLAEKYNLKVNLTTNGVLFPKYAQELGKCKSLNKINFSLHCENNIPNYCEEIFNNIKYLSENTTVIYRLWTLHNNELDDNSTKIVEKIKAHYNLSTDIVDKIKKENNIKIDSTIYVDKDNEFTWPEITSHKSCGYCYGLKTQLAILVDGTVVPCCLDCNGEVNLGNIFKQELEEIINSERYQKLKKSFQDRNPIEPLCKSCTFKEKFK